MSSPLKIICDIIQTEMELQQGQVYLWDQKVDVPSDERLYVAVSVGPSKPFGNSRKNAVDSQNRLIEVLSVNMQSTINIDILSRTSEARDRKEEVLMALKSTYSQQQQELHSFYVASIPTSFVNLSIAEGAAIPYRFNTSVNIQYFITKQKQIAYYDKFSESVQTEA